MRIRLNGEAQDVAAATLEELVAEAGWAGQPVAAERNRELVPRRLWASTALAPDDQIEIVHMVGGG
ncbi:MAG: sulfur carrier protein ThiS [Terriglobales bacterium]